MIGGFRSDMSITRMIDGNFWKRFRECFVFQSRVSTKTVVIWLCLRYFVFNGSSANASISASTRRTNLVLVLAPVLASLVKTRLKNKANSRPSTVEINTKQELFDS